MTTDEYTPDEDEMRYIYGDRYAYMRKEATAEFDRFLARVRREAVEEYKNRQVQIHLNPAPPQMVPVPVRCPKCGPR